MLVLRCFVLLEKLLGIDRRNDETNDDSARFGGNYSTDNERESQDEDQTVHEKTHSGVHRNLHQEFSALLLPYYPVRVPRVIVTLSTILSVREGVAPHPPMQARPFLVIPVVANQDCFYVWVDEGGTKRVLTDLLTRRGTGRKAKGVTLQE